MKKYRINYTLLKNWSCTKFVNAENEDSAKQKFFTSLMETPFEEQMLKKKDIKIDLFEDVSPKKGKKK